MAGSMSLLAAALARCLWLQSGLMSLLAAALALSQPQGMIMFLGVRGERGSVCEHVSDIIYFIMQVLVGA